MATLQTSRQINVENLLAIIKQLSPSELREFKRRFAAWQTSEPEAAEADLIKLTRLALLSAEARRLIRLIGKSERGTLTEKELAEYGLLARQAEEIDAQRAEALAALVRRRGKPIEIVQQETGWQSNGHGE